MIINDLRWNARVPYCSKLRLMSSGPMFRRRCVVHVWVDKCNERSSGCVIPSSTWVDFNHEPLWSARAFQVPVNDDGKQIGFDVVAGLLVEKLESMVSGHTLLCS